MNPIKWKIVQAAALWLLNQILRLWPQHEHRIKIIQKLQADLRELVEKRVTLYDLAVRNGTITAEFGTEAAQVFAEQFAALLQAKGAENYVECQFRRHVDHKRIIVHVRWEDGKTPHELRREAEAERDDLMIELEVARKSYAQLRSDFDLGQQKLSELVVEMNDLRRRVENQASWHKAFASCLDDIPEIRNMPGALPNGTWDPRAIRTVVETLARHSPITWNGSWQGVPKGQTAK